MELMDKKALYRYISDWQMGDAYDDYRDSMKDKLKKEIQYSILDDVLDVVENFPSANKWIPCKEKLPKRNLEVLLTIKQEKLNYVDYGCLISTEKWYSIYFNKIIDEVDGEVIAWQPMPEPYEED